MCYRGGVGAVGVWLPLMASIKGVSVAGAFSAQVYIAPENRIFGCPYPLHCCRGIPYLPLFTYSRQADLSLFCALPELFHVTLEGSGCSSEEDANGSAVTVAGRGAGRPLTGRKLKGMVPQKSCWWDHTDWKHMLFLVAGAHQDHVSNSSNISSINSSLV